VQNLGAGYGAIIGKVFLFATFIVYMTPRRCDTMRGSSYLTNQ